MKNDTLLKIDDIVAENRRRHAVLERDRYDPLTGVGCCGERVQAGGNLIPVAVLRRCPDYLSLTPLEQDRQRIVDDFEFWCVRCATIKDKINSKNVPLVLNKPQRRLLAVMEKQRVACKPVRVILLKARQWGGSTLVQMYLAWMQLVRHTGWNSLICGHLHVTSKGLKRMYNLLLRHYPRELLDDDEPPRFTKLEGQPNVQQLESRDALIITGSARSEDAVRGYDIAMAHLSEVAFWQDSTMHNPDDVVRSVCGSVALKPETVIVLESTANGVGDYFHSEWLRARMGRSDKEPVFVPWHEIDIYSQPVDDVQALWDAMDEYERTLWDDGCTLEQVNWYHHKRREYRDQQQMMAEFPSSASEAFVATGRCPFVPGDLDRMEQDCRQPVFTGDIQGEGVMGEEAKRGIHLVGDAGGLLKVWEHAERCSPVAVRYITVVDVGGRSAGSDYSVIAVWRVGDACHRHAIVAQWRGHIDHDLLAWKAMQLAKHYNDALLVVESNTLTNEAARAGQSDYILQEVNRVYGNVYLREGRKLGFHTNVKTKGIAIAHLIAAVRDGTYIERDLDAVNEMRDYEDHNGKYSARPGKHDDILMTRAIGLYLLHDKRVNPHRESPSTSLAIDTWFTGPS